MPKEQVDIAEMLIRKAGVHLAEAYAAFWEATTPGIPSKKLLQLRQREAEASIECMLLFQSGMEAIINEEITTNKRLAGVRKEREYHQRKVRDLSFKNKWENSYKAMEVEDTEKHLERYLEFYRDYRVPITHPKNRYFDVSPYTFPVTYAGMRNGWLAFMTLISMWEDSARVQSWEDFCEANNLPKEIADAKR
jgi:hypothetical protein